MVHHPTRWPLLLAGALYLTSPANAWVGHASMCRAVDSARRGAVRVRSSLEETNAEADPIRYLPPLDDAEDGMPDPKANVIPVFPLGSMVALPQTEQWLTIFEPRYRQMYDDIMLHGGRSFAVCTIDPKTGGMSETASVFYLDEVQEVSEQTADQIKYICKHTAIGRCKLTKIINPTAWFSAKTYLRAEYEEMTDEDADAKYPDEEKQILEVVKSVIELQDKINEEPRFDSASFPTFEDGLNNKELWSLASYWQTLAKERVNQIGIKAKEAMEKRIVQYISEDGQSLQPGEPIRLPPKLARELEFMNKRFQEEAETLQPATHVPFQRMLQSTSRKHRLSVMLEVVALEQGRLGAKDALRELFPMSAD